LIPQAKTLLLQPLVRVSELSASDIPREAGVYTWYRRGQLFYVGESHRGLRSRLWGNHIRGNARGSTPRNKVAKTFDFPPTGSRAYENEAEKKISAKLLECELRFLPLPHELIDKVQDDLIRELDPPMNDHPGQIPRWRVDDVREILASTPRPPKPPPA
jgi:GIY-YIG catalytic domain